jgi:16S rRNA (cytidine1402-2'-O)-methyltransferase
LSDLESVWGANLRVVVARELTKIHEEFLRGTVLEVRNNLTSRDRVRGEITLLVEAVPWAQAAQNESLSLPAQIAMLIAEGLTEKDALKQIARESGQGKSDLYRELQRERAKGSGRKS